MDHKRNVETKPLVCFVRMTGYSPIYDATKIIQSYILSDL